METRIFSSTAAALFLMFVLSITSSVSYANTSFQPSSWASEKMAISATAGITPEGFDSQPFTESITRRDFCELLINTCRIFGTASPEPPASHPFSDTTDIIAENAYLLGLTQGTAAGIFSPELPLTREMAAVMLSRMRMLFQSISDNNNYNSTTENSYGKVLTTPAGYLSYTQPMDEEQADQILEEYSADDILISGWAKTSMADVYTRGILSGTGEGRLDPKSNITREQAAMLSLNILTYYDEMQIRAAGVEECVLPKPAGIFISPSYNSSNVYLFWNDIPSASAYDITVFKNGEPTYSTRISENYIDMRTYAPKNEQPSRSSTSMDRSNSLYNSIFGYDQKTIDASIKVVPVNSSGDPSVFFLQQEFSISPWANDNQNPEGIEHHSSRYASQKAINELITGDPEKNQFANIKQANLNMADIKINVWKLTATGSKEASSLTITVNKNVAENVKKIFEDIYNGKEKFPIKSCQGYAYRNGTSQHSNGTAIDINPSENYFISLDGVIKSGTLWKPGKNPYSILPDGDVVRTFNRYGWHWSPDMKWSNGQDYMHFSLNGK